MLQNPVIIVHYHLRPGGVTKVIESQIQALYEAGSDYLVLTGEEYAGARGMKQTVLPALGYQTQTQQSIEQAADDLWEACRAAVHQRFATRPVTWLIHNPSLGKNLLWPALIDRIVRHGDPVLFQCHDFAEDGRPGNYALTAESETIYPTGPRIHYGFINSRDLALLIKAGLPAERTHLIANEVSPPTLRTESPALPAEQVILYPVRGIRRKNLGEFLLWSLLAPKGATFALTLAPKNPQWLPYYEVWEQLAKELQAPIDFGCVGRVQAPGQEGASFEDWLQAATHCFTSSVAEGFGLSFLEPLALGKPLIGRDLPDITCDFKQEGVVFDGLYQRLLVPTDQLDLQALFEELTTGLYLSYEAYEVPLTTSHIEEACEHFITAGCVDFANLPEHTQVGLLEKIAAGKLTELFVQTSGGELVPAKEWFAQALKIRPRPPHQQATDSYNTVAYQKRLLSILSQVEASAEGELVVSYLEKRNVLASYLDPKRYHFLRT